VNVRYGIRNQPEGNVRYFCYEVLQLCRSILCDSKMWDYLLKLEAAEDEMRRCMTNKGCIEVLGRG